MEVFNPKELKKLYQAPVDSNGEDNGQLTILGGSSLFHGAPIFSLKAASRIVDMVFFSSPEKQMEKIADYIKSELSSFIWVPFDEIDRYIEKSDAVLIGPGFMRFSSEKASKHIREEDCDDACLLTRNTTKELLQKFPNKKWVIDGGSLQTIEPSWIPKDAILTPNRREFKSLFSIDTLPTDQNELVALVQEKATQYKCVIVLKGVVTIVCSATRQVLVNGGNAGLTKGGSGDTQAGLTAALLSKNEPFLAAVSAAFVVKKSAEEIFERVGVFFNADDLAEEVPRTLASYLL